MKASRVESLTKKQTRIEDFIDQTIENVQTKIQES
jgi:hypothetical protein